MIGVAHTVAHETNLGAAPTPTNLPERLPHDASGASWRDAIHYARPLHVMDGGGGGSSTTVEIGRRSP